jgi:P22 coat protein - gene protein 5
MANTLTNLIPSIVRGFDVVSRELVGFIPTVNRDPSTDRLAKNQTLYSWASGAATLSDIAPSNVSPQAGDQTLTTKSISITSYKFSDFYFTGEEEKALAYSGSYGNIVTDKIEQAVRAIVNQMETDIATAASVGASRAYGTVGTVPFTGGATGAGSVAESAQVKKILDDNGAPQSNRSLILDTVCGAQLRTVYQLTKANEAGTTMTLRDGELLNLHGLSIKESAQIQQPAVGTAASATTDTAGYAVGVTTINLAATGTGTILAGDIITIAGNTDPQGNLYKYVVAGQGTGGGAVGSGGTLILAAPGLRKAIPASAKAVTVIGQSNRCLGYSKNAILLATRLPARPSGGDMASDVQTITDPRSGISIEVSMYPQYRQVRYEIAAAWGVTIIKPEHVASLIY